MKILAYIIVALCSASVLVGPFWIGKERAPRSASDYVGSLVECALTTVLAGRVLGWW